MSNYGTLTIGDKTYDVMAGGVGGVGLHITKEMYLDRYPEYYLYISIFAHDIEEDKNITIDIDLISGTP